MVLLAPQKWQTPQNQNFSKFWKISQDFRTTVFSIWRKSFFLLHHIADCSKKFSGMKKQVKVTSAKYAILRFSVLQSYTIGQGFIKHLFTFVKMAVHEDNLNAGRTIQLQVTMQFKCKSV